METISHINALCVDVDDLAGSSQELGRNVRDAEYCLERELDTLLSELDDLQISATFFVPGYALQRSPKLIREIAERGHDVASHGTKHDRIERLGPQQFQSDVADNKHLLEDCIGSLVDTYKAPCWSISQHTLWAYDVLIAAGFEIDHTAMPRVRMALGQPRHRLEPFRYEDRLLIIPPTTINVTGLPVRFCGGFYNAYVPASLQAFLLRRIGAAENIPFNFYFHPYEYSPAAANKAFVKYRSLFLTLYAAHAGIYRQHLRHLARNFRFGTLKSAYRRWIIEP